MSDVVVRPEVLQLERYNIEALDEALKAFFGERCGGVSIGKGHLTVHMKSDEKDDVDAIENIVSNHDPEVLSKRQGQVALLKEFKRKAEADEPISPKELADAVAALTALKIE